MLYIRVAQVKDHCIFRFNKSIKNIFYFSDKLMCHHPAGKWLPAEEDRLTKAVYQLANAVPGEMISTGLSWATVADRVGTRSEKQCRTKWLNYLNWKVAGGTDWTREDDINLICRLV